MSDLNIGKAIWQIRFPPSALLFDNRGRIASDWQHKRDLSEWRISQNDVLIHNPSHSTHLYSSFQEISVVSEVPTGLDDFKQIAADFSAKTLDILEIRKLTRVGLRLIMFTERKHFRSLITKMRTKLYRLTEDDWNILGGYPEDIGSLSLILKLGDNRANFSIGPMERNQFVEQLQSNEAKAKLPEVLVYVDFDLFRLEPKWSSKSYYKDVSSFLTEGGEEIQRLANAFVGHFGGFV